MAELKRDAILLMTSFLDQIKIKDVMIKNVVKIYEDDELSIAEQKFVENHINYLVVIDHDKKIVGLLSRKYLYKTLAPRKIVSEEMDYDPQIIIDGDSFYEKATLDNFILRNIMNKNPSCLKPEDSLKTALLMMAEKKVSCIPVIDANKKPVGVLSHQEIVGYVGRLLNLK